MAEHMYLQTIRNLQNKIDMLDEMNYKLSASLKRSRRDNWAYIIALIIIDAIQWWRWFHHELL